MFLKWCWMHRPSYCHWDEWEWEWMALSRYIRALWMSQEYLNGCCLQVKHEKWPDFSHSSPGKWMLTARRDVVFSWDSLIILTVNSCDSSYNYTLLISFCFVFCVSMHVLLMFKQQTLIVSLNFRKIINLFFKPDWLITMLFQGQQRCWSRNVSHLVKSGFVSQYRQILLPAWSRRMEDSWDVSQ